MHGGGCCATWLSLSLAAVVAVQPTVGQTCATGARCCPEHSSGPGGGALCTCDLGYEGKIEYNRGLVPPDYEGTCRKTDEDYLFGIGTGFLLGIIFFIVSALLFVVASKTSFECSTLTNFGLLLFWSLLTLFVVYAPRKGADEVNPSREIDDMWWSRFGMSVLLYGGSVGGLVLLLKDLVLFKLDRTTRVVLR